MDGQSYSEIGILVSEFVHFLLDGSLVAVHSLFFKFPFAIVGTPEGVPEGDAVHSELLRHIPHHESHVVILEESLAVHEKNEQRGAHSSLDQVVYLQRVILFLRQISQFLEILQPIVQQSCGNPGVPFVVSCNHLIHQTIQVQMHLCTYKHEWVAVEFPKISFKLPQKVVFRFVTVRFLNGFPFVDCNHNWSTLLNHSLDQSEVINPKRFKSVHDKYDDVTFLHVQHCADLNFFLIFLESPVKMRGVQTSCVDDLYFSSLVFKVGSDCIPSGAWHIRDHHFVSPDHLVDQG